MPTTPTVHPVDSPPIPSLASILSEWEIDSAGAVRVDVATLAHAHAEAVHRAESSEDSALRLHAAEVTLSDALTAYWEDTWPL